MSQASFASLSRALPAISREMRGRRLPFAAFLGLLVLAGYLAAHLTWQFMPAGTGTEGAAARAPLRPAPGQSPQHGPAADIAAAHLFGTAAASSAEPSAVDAPETSLDLTLLGVAAGSSGAPSQAIISSGSSGHQDTYGVGAKLPGGALIRRILPDRVVIAHNGRLESLRLPVAGTSILASNMSFGNGGGRSGAGKQQHRAPPSPAQVRKKIESNPKSLSDYMRLRPYAKKGHLEGYRVYPGKFPALFRKTGLRPGDIVTKVNGIDLDNPKANMRAISQIKNAKGPVHLVVQRGGKSVQVTVNIPGG